MTSSNPFAPPGAIVDDISMGALVHQPVRLWPPGGRMARRRYVAYGVGVMLLTWTCVLALIPLVSLYWRFKGGTPGPNRFGAPPPPNTLGVKILALLFPVIFGIGILAAIVLPAYQDFTKRAHAVQRP